MNSQVPIMLDYYDASNPSTELVTTFLDCEFRVSFLSYLFNPLCFLSLKQNIYHCTGSAQISSSVNIYYHQISN